MHWKYLLINENAWFTCWVHRLVKDGSFESTIEPSTISPLCVCSPLCPLSYFIWSFFPLQLQQNVLTLLHQSNSQFCFPFTPFFFCIHPYPPFISTASCFWPGHSFLCISLYPHLPLHVCLFVCVCGSWGACGYFSGSSPEDWTVIIYGPEL